MAAGPVRLELRAEAIDELSSLSQNVARLPIILAEVASLPRQVGVNAVSQRLATKLNMDSAELRSILVAILNFYKTSLRYKITISETADAVSEYLKRVEPEFYPDLPEEWDAAKAKVVESASLLYADHPLVTAQKAFTVATSRQYELVDVRIFTDMRPVFSDSGESILQSVVSYVLSLDYHDCHDHKVIQFTLDAEDIGLLKGLCERAEKKSAVIKNEFQSMAWPTTVLREPHEADTDGNA